MTPSSSQLPLPVLGATLGVALLLGLGALAEPADDDDAVVPNVQAMGGHPGTHGLDEQLQRFQHPPPTEHWLERDAEGDNKEKRKAWMSEMHRAAPGTDWKAIERTNGLSQMARRRLLAPPTAGEAHGTWVERGSDNQAGRMHVARHGPDGATLYAGSSKGGVWKGGLDGTGWEPIGDNLYGGAHWLEVMPGAGPADPPVVVAATDGGLVHRTVDDGATWEDVTGLDGLSSVHRLIMSSDGTHTLFLQGSTGSGSYLWRSGDRGATWELIYDLGGYTGDVWLPRDGDATVYMLTGGTLYTSDDLGEAWTAVGDLPTLSSRVELVGSEAGAPRLWAVVDSATLYRSDDAGATWRSITAVSDYWGTLNASVQDADLFAWGGVEVWFTDNGRTFHHVNGWAEYYGDPVNKLHADNPGMDVVVDASGQEIWYLDTDGGLYRSLDGLQTVENLSLDGLRVSQYYDTLTSTANPEHVAAGAQDQGYQVSNTIEQDADEAFELDQILSGDYGHLTSGDGTHAFVYSTYPGFILVQVGEDSPGLIYASFPSGESYVPWIPPVVADPDDRESFYFPASRLYKYTRSGSSWPARLYSEHSFVVDSGEYASAMAFSPLDSDRVYVATSSGRAWVSEDHGLTWTESVNRVADDNWYYGQAIVASNTDVDTVYIGGSGYSVPAVYRSTDGGFTFEPFGDGLPDTMVYCLCEAASGSGVLVAGTETGVYRRDPHDSAWWDATEAGVPITTYWSCEALVHEDSFRFGTYGRGMWDYQFVYEPPAEDTGGPGDTGADGGGTEDGGTPEDGGGTLDGGGTEDGGAVIDGGVEEAPQDGGGDSSVDPVGGEDEDGKGSCSTAPALGGLLWLLLPLWTRRERR